MSTWIEIKLKPGIRRRPLGKLPGPEKVLSGGKMIIELEKNNTWRLASPLHPDWRYYIPDFAAGTWKTGIATELYFYGRNGKECFLVRDYKKLNGPAFYGLQGNRYEVSTRWKRTTRPLGPVTGCWSGIGVKGALGIGIGAEDVPAAVVSWDNKSKRASFNIISGRLGLSGGFSGGLALVVLTGFTDINHLNGYSLSGWDWTLSIGAKLKGLDKLEKTGSLLSDALASFNQLGKLNHFDDLIPAIKRNEQAADLVGAGKSVISSFGYDWKEKSVTVIDVPLAGGGAEVGIYLYYGSCKLLSQW